jgi:CheY-like chemotaxis protein
MRMPAELPVALVADDDRVTRRVLTMLLERQGFRVLVAEDGQQALDHVRSGKPRIVFLDARMPAPDGYDVCRTIREERLAVPEPFVIMLTAARQESDRRRAAAAGVNEFLTKPFSPSKLSTRLEQLSEVTAS